MSVLLVEKKDGVAIVTLNRPEARNALSSELRAALVDAFSALEADTEIRAIILTGAGKAFCAGLDLGELSSGTAGDAATDASLVATIERCRCPVIAAINGFAITGGFELALACDILVASTEGRFADTHARVGILPGWGLSQKLSRLIGIGRAKRLSFTGDFLDAERAEAWGLVSEVVEPAALLPTCLGIARDIASCDAETLQRYKRVIDDGFAATYGEALHIEAKAAAEHARNVRPEAIGERRAGIQARGRTQADS